MWDPQQYLKFSRERSRPFLDLLTQVRRERVDSIVDLGCGPGLLTRTMADRWLAAHVIGVDSSQAMLAQAQALALPGRLEFVAGDLTEWTPPAPVDLIVSNAALHWVGDHPRLLGRLAQQLTAGGTLAVQMPNSFESRAHEAVAETVTQSHWRSLLAESGSNREHVHPLPFYVETLLDLGFHVDGWETTYVHVLRGDNPVLDWLKGTTLRPLLDRLEPAAAAEFLGELGPRLLSAYPPRGDVTLFPFRRLFFVASRQQVS